MKRWENVAKRTEDDKGRDKRSCGRYAFEHYVQVYPGDWAKPGATPQATKQTLSQNFTDSALKTRLQSHSRLTVPVLLVSWHHEARLRFFTVDRVRGRG